MYIISSYTTVFSIIQSRSKKVDPFQINDGWEEGSGEAQIKREIIYKSKQDCIFYIGKNLSNQKCLIHQTKSLYSAEDNAARASES